MFIKLFFDKEQKELLLNIDSISSVYTVLGKWQKDENDNIIQIEEYNYEVTMNNGDCFHITKEQYEQLCVILTKRL